MDTQDNWQGNEAYLQGLVPPSEGKSCHRTGVSEIGPNQRSRFFLPLLCYFWGDFLLRPQEEICGSFLGYIMTPDSSEGDDYLS